MTSLSQESTHTPPVGSSDRSLIGPTASFLIQPDPVDDTVALRFDPDVEVSRVDLTEQGDIAIQWGPEAKGEISFRPPEGTRLDSVAVGWLASELASGEAENLPFQARLEGETWVLILTRPKASATYSCFFDVQTAAGRILHDPKIYNDVPPGEPPC